jgi:hypothetical protein
MKKISKTLGGVNMKNLNINNATELGLDKMGIGHYPSSITIENVEDDNQLMQVIEKFHTFNENLRASEYIEEESQLLINLQYFLGQSWTKITA